MGLDLDLEEKAEEPEAIGTWGNIHKALPDRHIRLFVLAPGAEGDKHCRGIYSPVAGR